jgi:hypothetical protein
MNKLDVLRFKQNLYAIKLKLKKPIVRNTNIVIEEYDNYWKNAQIFNNIIINKNPNEVIEFSDHGVYSQTTHIEFLQRSLHEFLKFVQSSCSVNEPIVELGCGTGSKLFYLEDNGFKDLEGYELTVNGTKKAKEFGEIKKSNVKIKQCDITRDNLDIENKTVVTFLSLEQLKLGLDNLIDKIVDSKPKQILSFESIFKSRFEKYYAEYTGYQTDYYEILKNKKQIKLLQVEEFLVNPNLLRPVYFIKWKINN